MSMKNLLKTAKKRCNCESAHCKEGHKPGNCNKSAGDKKALYVGSICDTCATYLPAKYMKESSVLEQLTDYLSKVAQIFQNYDYAPGAKSGPGVSVFRQMDDGKVKSIEEWRKKNKKQQKANEKKITDTKLVPAKEVKQANDISKLADKIQNKWLQTNASFAGTLDEQMKLVRKTLQDLLTELSYLVFSKSPLDITTTDNEQDANDAEGALKQVNDLHYILNETFAKATTTPDIGAFSPWLVLLHAARKTEQVIFDLDAILDPGAKKSQHLANELLKQLKQAKQLAQLEEGSADAPHPMTTKVDTDVDQFSQEDVHPDHPEYQDPIEDAENWEDVGENALWKKKNPNADMDDARDGKTSKANTLTTLAEKLNEKWLFRGEMTPELEEKFTAIHENMTLLHRELMAMEQERSPFVGKEFSATEHIASIRFAMQLLNQTEKLLTPERFLRFDFNRQYAVIDGGIERMTELQEDLRDMSKIYPKALQYAASIITDLSVAADLFDRQSDVLDKGIRTEPTRMSEQVDTDVDQIPREDIHPDSPDFDPEMDVSFREEFPDEKAKKEYRPF